ncbi:hypothetical protein AGMMS50256_06620 [Betaproteobacteria bacterium]|nr:hypothetical protein AGMMS50256_06620 [Betaproteobacteria bacterium]
MKNNNMKNKIDTNDELYNNNFYSDDIQEEIEKNRTECFDILQHNERVQEFKEIYKKKF